MHGHVRLDVGVPVLQGQGKRVVVGHEDEVGLPGGEVAVRLVGVFHVVDVDLEKPPGRTGLQKERGDVPEGGNDERALRVLVACPGHGGGYHDQQRHQTASDNDQTSHSRLLSCVPQARTPRASSMTRTTSSIATGLAMYPLMPAAMNVF